MVLGNRFRPAQLSGELSALLNAPDFFFPAHGVVSFMFFVAGPQLVYCIGENVAGRTILFCCVSSNSRVPGGQLDS